jgi:3-deoxy-D-manno-octulosonic-acid transferase
MARQQMSWQLRIVLQLERWSLPLWRWALGRRLSSSKETQLSMHQKLMLHLPEHERVLPQGTPLIWGHAVGVGEVLALLGLFRKLSESLPGHHFLLTSSSRTSGEALAKQNLPAHFHHQYAPIDHPTVLARFFEVWQPLLACWSETDLWPGMVCATRERGIPMLMLNARLDQTKATRMVKMYWFYLPLLSCFSRIYAQNASSLEHLKALDLSGVLASVVGNIKAVAPALRVDADQFARCQAVWGHRPIWLVASSHLGEEAIALQAHCELLKTQSEALLIIVPRDAFRGADISALAQRLGLSYSLRSREETLQTLCQVYVADTMGELGLWYALSPIALMGGSLVPVGGHNPYEAIAAGCRVLHGPAIHHFSESYSDLHAKALAQTVRNPEELASSITAHWAMPRLSPINHSRTLALLDDIVAQIHKAKSA